MKGIKVNNQCNFCGNRNFKKKKVQYTYRRKNELFLVNNVPCEQCEFCGEQYFNTADIKKIEHEFQAIKGQQRQNLKYLQVPLQEFMNIGDT